MIVSSSRPRCFRSFKSPAIGRSTRAQSEPWFCFNLPCASQPPTGVYGPEAGGPVCRDTTTAVAGRAAKDDELRQVVAQCPQAIVNPGADRWMEALEDVPAGVELQLGGVIVVGRPHRAHDGEVVGTLAEARPPVAEFHAILAALREADLQWIELVQQRPRRADEVH